MSTKFAYCSSVIFMCLLYLFTTLWFVDIVNINSTIDIIIINSILEISSKVHQFSLKLYCKKFIWGHNKTMKHMWLEWHFLEIVFRWGGNDNIYQLFLYIISNWGLASSVFQILLTILTLWITFHTAVLGL